MARKKGEAAATGGRGKGKGKQQEPTGSAASVNPTNVGMIKASKLNSLLVTARKAYKDQRAISGELGAEIKEAAEHDNLHKKAFAMIRGIDRLEPEKLADFFAHFDYYCDVSGLRKRAGSVMRMPLDDGKEVGEQKPRASNVEQFPMPKGEAAE